MHAPRLLQAAVALTLVTILPGCAVFQMVFAVGAGAGYLAVNKTMSKAEREAQRTVVRTTLIKFRQAVEEYAIDHDGQFPAVETALTELEDGNYISEPRFPDTPWAETPALRQANMPDLGPLEPADRDAAPTAVGTRLGVGHAPDGKPYDALTFGAVVYDVTPEQDAFVIYGIVDRGGQAAVSDVFTSYEVAPSDEE